MTPHDLSTHLTENFAPWVLATGLTIAEAATTHVLTHMQAGPDLARQGGIVSGQALAAMADTTIILALAAHRGRFIPAATTDLHVQFLRPGTGLIACRASISRAGRILAFARAEMTGPDGKLVAQASATLALPPE